MRLHRREIIKTFARGETSPSDWNCSLLKFSRCRSVWNQFGGCFTDDRVGGIPVPVGTIMLLVVGSGRGRGELLALAAAEHRSSNSRQKRMKIRLKDTDRFILWVLPLPYTGTGLLVVVGAPEPWWFLVSLFLSMMRSIEETTNKVDDLYLYLCSTVLYSVLYKTSYIDQRVIIDQKHHIMVNKQHTNSRKFFRSRVWLSNVRKQDRHATWLLAKGPKNTDNNGKRQRR